MATFVLIPGAGADPRVYEMTIAELSAMDHRAIAPQLPLSNPAAAPSDHAEAVLEALPGDGEIVVVAQSLGAFAGTITAERGAVAELILLAPMIPAPGESAGEWWENTGHADAISATIERHGSMAEWGQDALAEVFLHDVPEDIRAASAEFEGAPGPGMFGEPLPLTRWPDVPTRVLAPREDRLFPLEFQTRLAGERLGIEVDEMEGGHLPMLSRPRALAERLVELAAGPEGPVRRRSG